MTYDTCQLNNFLRGSTFEVEILKTGSDKNNQISTRCESRGYRLCRNSSFFYHLSCSPFLAVGFRDGLYWLDLDDYTRRVTKANADKFWKSVCISHRCTKKSRSPLFWEMRDDAGHGRLKSQVKKPDKIIVFKNVGWWRTNYRSASSSTSTSNSRVLTTSFPFPSRNSSIRPGVPMTISAFVDKKRVMSWLGDESEEEINRSGGGYVAGEGSCAEVKGDSKLVSGCADKKTEKTACICVASSLYMWQNWIIFNQH